VDEAFGGSSVELGKNKTHFFFGFSNLSFGDQMAQVL